MRGCACLQYNNTILMIEEAENDQSIFRDYRAWNKKVRWRWVRKLEHSLSKMLSFRRKVTNRPTTSQWARQLVPRYVNIKLQLVDTKQLVTESSHFFKERKAAGFETASQIRVGTSYPMSLCVLPIEWNLVALTSLDRPFSNFDDMSSMIGSDQQRLSLSACRTSQRAESFQIRD